MGAWPRRQALGGKRSPHVAVDANGGGLAQRTHGALLGEPVLEGQAVVLEVRLVKEGRTPNTLTVAEIGCLVSNEFPADLLHIQNRYGGVSCNYVSVYEPF